ncbi:MAG TPA: type 1 glutamine amidotransferase [Acidiferrobacteraceae bacterium]|nr:type 1 glutamine amidotransferase [Acidiferrobacteraceae bacterium]
MPKLLISRHIACEGPGYLGEVLKQKGIGHHTVKVDAGEALPETLDGYDGLVLMGGPMSVNDTLPWIPSALSLIRQAQEHDMPVLGHCLGGQLIAKALGGEVTPNPVPEIGWLPVQQVAGPQGWLNDVPQQFTAFHWHGESFSLPQGASRILASQACNNQAFVMGRTLAMQCHIEVTAPMVPEWANLYADQIAQPTETVQSAQELTAGLERRIQDLMQIANKIYARWLQALQ